MIDFIIRVIYSLQVGKIFAEEVRKACQKLVGLLFRCFGEGVVDEAVYFILENSSFWFFGVDVDDFEEGGVQQ